MLAFIGGPAGNLYGGMLTPGEFATLAGYNA